jgi:hypothetical protein
MARDIKVDNIIVKYYLSNMNASMGVSEICYILFRGKTDHLFAGKEMQLMLSSINKDNYLPISI